MTFKVVRARSDSVFEERVNELLKKGYKIVNCVHDGEAKVGRSIHVGYLIKSS